MTVHKPHSRREEVLRELGADPRRIADYAVELEIAADHHRMFWQKAEERERGLQEQLEAANARKDELWKRLLDMEGKYLDTHERLVKVAEWYGHDLDAALGSNPAIRPEASERGDTVAQAGRAPAESPSGQGRRTGVQIPTAGSSRSEAFDPTSSATASTDAVSPAPGHQRSDLPESRSESSPASEPEPTTWSCAICGAHWSQTSGADRQVHHEGCPNWREGDTCLPRASNQERSRS